MFDQRIVYPSYTWLKSSDVPLLFFKDVVSSSSGFRFDEAEAADSAIAATRTSAHSAHPRLVTEENWSATSPLLFFILITHRRDADIIAGKVRECTVMT